MASAIGPSPDALAYLERLAADAPHLDFFQVVRRLESLYPETPGFGRSLRPREDPVRLGQEPSLAFVPGTLHGLEQPASGGAPWLRQYFFGLFGVNGPLPIHLTEYALHRRRAENDSTLVRFADLFHHRMLSLLYRAWVEGRPAASADRPATDPFAGRLAALAGMGEPALRHRDGFPDQAKLFYAGLLATQTRHVEGLRAIIRDYFNVTAEILEFQGAWMELPASCRLALGGSRETGGLGLNAVLGAQVWGCQQRFRIVLGPMNLAEYEGFLPGGDNRRELLALVTNYQSLEKDWDLQLLLRSPEVPVAVLGGGGRLGWTLWSGQRPPGQYADELVLAGSTH